MSRSNYTRKRGCWTEEEMKGAIDLLMKNTMSIRRASRKFRIPFKTLRDKFQAIKSGETVALAPRFGRYKTFTNDKIDEVVSILKEADRMLMPYTRDEFLKLIYDLAEYYGLPHQFNKKTKLAGKQFYYFFTLGHPEAPFKMPDLMAFEGFDKQKVKHFFDTYESLISEYKFTPDRIHNCDYIEFPVGKKNITVLLTINAIGNLFIPPVFVIPTENNLDAKSMIEAPLGSIFTTEINGRLSASSFRKYLELLIQKTKPTEKEPILLLLSAQSAHKEAEILFYAKKHHIYILSFICGTAAKMEPLERTIFKPFKTAYDEACKIKLSGEFFGNITEKDIPGLVNIAYSAIYRKDLAQEAFGITGLWPIDRSVYIDLDILFANPTFFTSLFENLDCYKKLADFPKSGCTKNTQGADIPVTDGTENSESAFSEYPEVLEFALSAFSLARTPHYDYDKSCIVH